MYKRYPSWILPSLIYLISQLIFLINLQFPKEYNYDEFHYIPAAKQFLELKPNKNWEHPPLAKLIMAVSIRLMGDYPIGWRFPATVFGSWLLVGIYFLAKIFFHRTSTALWTTVLTLLGQLVYVQSRIGMLDTFMITFLVWSMYFFCSSWQEDLSTQQKLRCFQKTGILLGLSIACKWFAIVAAFGMFALIILIRLLQQSKIEFKRVSTGSLSWYHPMLWSDLTIHNLWISLIFIPFMVYSMTFIPFIFIPHTLESVNDFIQMQIRMWHGQQNVVGAHPYMSYWWEWPLITRPIWYSFEKEGLYQEWVRGVLLIGNPWIMWSGLLAMGYCFYRWIQNQHRALFWIIYFYALYFCCWWVIPRKIFFYYYYYPASLMLSFALAAFFDQSFFLKRPWIRWSFLGIAGCFFIYFLPILAAFKIPTLSFIRWMWQTRWI